jgi:hypothetical protein
MQVSEVFHSSLSFLWISDSDYQFSPLSGICTLVPIAASPGQKPGFFVAISSQQTEDFSEKPSFFVNTLAISLQVWREPSVP